jgi:hypothetical protein
MKALMIAVSLAACATASLAHAADPASTTIDSPGAGAAQQWSPHGDMQRRTRAEVREELVQAQKSGQTAYLNKTLYRGGN